MKNKQQFTSVNQIHHYENLNRYENSLLPISFIFLKHYRYHCKNNIEHCTSNLLTHVQRMVACKK